MVVEICRLEAKKPRVNRRVKEERRKRELIGSNEKLLKNTSDVIALNLLTNTSRPVHVKCVGNVSTCKQRIRSHVMLRAARCVLRPPARVVRVENTQASHVTSMSDTG